MLFINHIKSSELDDAKALCGEEYLKWGYFDEFIKEVKKHEMGINTTIERRVDDLQHYITIKTIYVNAKQGKNASRLFHFPIKPHKDTWLIDYYRDKSLQDAKNDIVIKHPDLSLKNGTVTNIRMTKSKYGAVLCCSVTNHGDKRYTNICLSFNIYANKTEKPIWEGGINQFFVHGLGVGETEHLRRTIPAIKGDMKDIEYSMSSSGLEIYPYELEYTPDGGVQLKKKPKN